jgi:UV DNA damage endonuclease
MDTLQFIGTQQQVFAMKIGYPCINNWIGCTSSQTFRLKSYSEDRLKEKIGANLVCLQKTLEYNVAHGLLFFRIASGIIPFASHPVNTFDWQEHFRRQFEEIGEYITSNNFRISVHPDQFTLINSLSEDIFARSRNELRYHADLLDCLKLDYSAKIQIHVGGAYGDKANSMATFTSRYNTLDNAIKRRLVIENDERLYSANDCLSISKQTGIPVLLDVFHHKINHKPDSTTDYLKLANETWNQRKDGILMVDYSSQKPNGKIGQHAESIDEADFRRFMQSTKQYDFDVMLEIKDKEVSALKALKILNDARRSS